MATVKAFVRASNRKNAEVNIRFRLSVRRGMLLYHTSELRVNPLIWDNKAQAIKPKAICTTVKKNEITTGVAARKSLILEIYDNASNKDGATSEWLELEIDKRLHPEKYDIEETVADAFFVDFEEFLKKRKYSDWRIKSFNVVIRALKRYELFVRLTDPGFRISFDNITPSRLDNIDAFLRDEHTLFEKHPTIYQAVPESRPPKPRGQNTINGIFTKLRTYFIWAKKNGKTANNPFENYSIEESIYGTPCYITIDERDKLYRTNLSRHPKLAVQRDIFVFQCLIGCRVGDFMDMTKSNVINGAIEYIARKTKDGHPVTVRVPLNPTAKEILDKYNDCGNRLLPFILPQDYNDAIKLAFLAARLRRPVVVLDTLTREPVIKPLNEIASSHMARRTFVGNLYKKVKDPNLVGALSGHKEGSRSFARYRDIDEDMKIDLVNLLEK